MVLDVAVDPAAVPEGVIPTHRITPAAAVAEAEPRVIEWVIEAAVTAPVERVLDDTGLARVHAVAELNDHSRALRVGRRRVTTRLQLLRDDPGIALEFQAAVGSHAFARDDEERL